MCYFSETQIRKALQESWNAIFEIYNKLKEKFKSIDLENVKLQKELQIAKEVMGTQKELIFIYQTEQQPPLNHAVRGELILPQYDSHDRSHQYPPYQPLSSHEFIMNTTCLPPPNDNYSITLLEPSYNTSTAISTPVTWPESQTPMSM
jgi:hypothetical protein